MRTLGSPIHGIIAGCLCLGSPLACSDPGGGLGTGTGTGVSSSGGQDASSGSPTTPGTTVEPSVDSADGTSGSGSTAGSTAAGSDSTAADTTAAPVECTPVPRCDALPPDPGPNIDWQNNGTSVVVASGAPRHRGRDMFYNPGDTQWVMAKFAYGLFDADLEAERVDLYLLRGCEGTDPDDWEYLGPTFTTNEGDHPTVEGVEDTGGRVYFQIPVPLEVGRHRIHMVVRGDGSRADTYLEIVEPGTPIILSDIDGTLTTDEWERLIDFLADNIPEVNEGAPEALHALVDRGYRPMYLTARPEFLGDRTYDFIEQRGLPPGIIHTTLSATGALGDTAVMYKTAELSALASRGLVPTYVFGNTDSDAAAYDNAGILPLDHRIFFQFDDELGGRTIDSYLELVPEFEAVDPVCQ